MLAHKACLKDNKEFLLATSKFKEFHAITEDGKKEYFKLFVLAGRVVSWIEFGRREGYGNVRLETGRPGNTALPERMLKSMHSLRSSLLEDKSGKPDRLSSKS